MNTLKNFVLYSGGAYGADTLFGEIAVKFGVGTQFHIRPAGNEKLTPNLVKLGLKPYVASKEILDKAREALKDLLGISYSDTIAGNLQCRNYYQVIKSDSVFTVAKLNSDLKSVSDGTNTAVQVGIKLNKPVLVLNVEDLSWYCFNYNKGLFVACTDPILTRKFTGIGTRDIQDYKVKDKVSGEWVSRPEYLGKDVENRVKAKIEKLFSDTMGLKKIIPCIVSSEHFSPALCEANPKHFYVFGDNTKRVGKGGQAIIRDCDNAFGIATKVAPSLDDSAFFNDSDYESNCAIIDEDIYILATQASDSGAVVVFPSAGIGTGLAQMKERCPRTFAYLNKRLFEVFGFKNPM